MQLDLYLKNYWMLQKCYRSSCHLILSVDTADISQKPKDLPTFFPTTYNKKLCETKHVQLRRNALGISKHHRAARWHFRGVWYSLKSVLQTGKNRFSSQIYFSFTSTIRFWLLWMEIQFFRPCFRHMGRIDLAVTLAENGKCAAIQHDIICPSRKDGETTVRLPGTHRPRTRPPALRALPPQPPPQLSTAERQFVPGLHCPADTWNLDSVSRTPPNEICR